MRTRADRDTVVLVNLDNLQMALIHEIGHLADSVYNPFRRDFELLYDLSVPKLRVGRAREDETAWL